MKMYWIKTVSKAVMSGLALLAPVLLPSCVGEEPVECPDKSEDAYFTLQLNLTDPEGQSRGDITDIDKPWNLDYGSSAGFGWELVQNSIAVLVYDTDGNYFGSFSNLVQVSNDKFNARLKKSGGSYALGEELEGKTFRFHVFVNALPESAPATESGLCTMSPVQWYATGGKYAMTEMPMWGMTEATLTWEAIPDSDRKKAADIGTVSLLRSVAKVEVILDDSLNPAMDYLDWVEVSGQIARSFRHVPGYSGQTASYAVTEVNESGALFRYHASFTAFPPTVTATAGYGEKFYPPASDKKRVCLYIPEQVNDYTTADKEVKIIVKAGGEVFDSSPLRFCKYGTDGKPTGNPLNIIRNHHYIFRVSIRMGHLEVEVADWEAAFDNNFNF